MLITDDFNRAGPGIGPQWTSVEGSPLLISGNHVICTTGAETEFMAYTGVVFDNDQYAQIRITSVNGTNYPFLGVRQTGSGATSCGYYIYALVGGNSITLRRRINAVDTDLQSYTPTINSGSSMKISVAGQGTVTTIKVYVDNVQTGSDYVDSSGSARNTGSPFIGMYDQGGGVNLDDFVAGTPYGYFKNTLRPRPFAPGSAR